MDLPKKWELSSLGTLDERVLGYVIVSEKKEGTSRYAFVHRTFVLPSFRRSAVLIRLTKLSLGAAAKNGLTQARWYCSPLNKRVYRFHQSFADGILGSKADAGTTYDLFYKDL